MGTPASTKCASFRCPAVVFPLGAGSQSAIAPPDAAGLAAAATLAAGDRLMLYAPTAIEVLTVRDVRSRDELLVLSWVLPVKSASFFNAYHANDPARRG